MRKIVVVLILAVALIGGYTAYWFKKAGDFRQMLEQSITAINDQAKALNGKDTLIRYSSIEISGYPFAMTLQLTKPIIDFPASAFLQNVPHSGPATPSFEWIEEISYGDKVSLSGNLTGNRFTLTAAGDRTHTTLVDRTERHNLIGTSSTPLICHLSVKQDGGMPWTMRPIFSDLQTFFAIFRSMDCNVRGIALKDLKSGAPLISSDEFAFAASNEPDGVYHKLAFSTDSKNVKATPAFDTIANDYTTMVYTLAGTPVNQRMTMTPASLYGNQNMAIDFAYVGPTQSGGFSDPAMHFKLDINKFDMKSDLFDIGGELHLASEPANDNRSASIVIHAHSEISQPYDQLIAKQFAATLTQIKQSGAKTGPQAEAAQIMALLGTPEAVAAYVMPNFHSLGKVVFDADTKAKGPNSPTEFFMHGNYTLDTLDWVATPYGIKFKGSANLSVPKKMPSGELIATCLTCDALITDLGGYALRVETLVNRAQTPAAPPRLSKELIEGVRKFLHGIAENSTANDLVIHLLVKDTGEITVSGKQIPEVISLFAQYIVPNMSAQPAQAMPAAGKQLPPPTKRRK